MVQDSLETLRRAEEPAEQYDQEPRWPAFIAVLAVGGLYAALPEALTFGPRWLFPSVVLTLLVPTVVSHHTGSHPPNATFGFALAPLPTLAPILPLTPPPTPHP